MAKRPSSWIKTDLILFFCLVFAMLTASTTLTMGSWINSGTMKYLMMGQNLLLLSQEIAWSSLNCLLIKLRTTSHLWRKTYIKICPKLESDLVYTFYRGILALAICPRGMRYDIKKLPKKESEPVYRQLNSTLELTG